MPASLTPRQQQVYDFILSAIARRRISPTVREIADALGVRPNAAACHLDALARKGLIERVPGVARGIIVCDPLYRRGCVLRLLGRISAGGLVEAIEVQDEIDLAHYRLVWTLATCKPHTQVGYCPVTKPVPPLIEWPGQPLRATDRAP